MQRLDKVVRQASDDPCVATYKNDKTLDFVRRNSCGDICRFFWFERLHNFF